MQTTIETAVTIPELVSFDLYRDIHKAIRSEMFDVTLEAGRIDPDDLDARRAHAARVKALADLLVHHAEHEDSNLDAEIAILGRAHTAEISAAHFDLEARMVAISELAFAALECDDRRAGAHALYLDLAQFTGAYLQHQDFEERVVMRLLSEQLDIGRLLELHEQILASVDPDVMARCLTLMLPAINVVDRTEMLGGMRATAPAEVFDGVWAMTTALLSTAELAATATRLGLEVAR